MRFVRCLFDGRSDIVVLVRKRADTRHIRRRLRSFLSPRDSSKRGRHAREIETRNLRLLKCLLDLLPREIRTAYKRFRDSFCGFLRILFGSARTECFFHYRLLDVVFQYALLRSGFDGRISHIRSNGTRNAALSVKLGLRALLFAHFAVHGVFGVVDTLSEIFGDTKSLPELRVDLRLLDIAKHIVKTH